jgi:hypothetical protein
VTLAVDASSPAAVFTTTTSAVTASFTPPANSLLVALVSCGNGPGSGSTTGAVTDSGGNTWTLKKRENRVGDSVGSAEIWAMDAGSSPTARTVTLTSVLAGSALDVLVLTGAASLASQTATPVSSITNTYAISVTSTVAGSQIVGSFAQTVTAVTLVVNGITTSYQSINDASGGATHGKWGSSSLTGTPGAATYGYTNAASAGVEIVGWEILPASVLTSYGTPSWQVSVVRS